jgi:GMP synthase-like glutamine amidotransferase
MKNEFILIQHTETTTPGTVLPWLKERGVNFKYLKMQNGDPFPQVEKNQKIILCGGGVHVDQEDQYPWLKTEKEYLKAHVKAGNKMVGLCLGGQLCAQILGAKVYPHPKGWEIGWWDIHIRSTPSLLGFEASQKIKFSQYHRYVFEAPQDSIVIAHNDWWEPQAFLWEDQVLGFQFHPERDIGSSQRLALEKDLPTEGQTQTKEEILSFTKACQQPSEIWFKKVLDGFLLES